MWRLGCVGVLAPLWLLGCIGEGARPAADTTPALDTVADTADSAEAIEPGDSGEPETGVPDISEGDGGGQSDGSQIEVIASACVLDEECVDTAAPCHKWVCELFQCVEEPDSGSPCEDGDLCTRDDFCDGGVCAQGQPVDCGDLAPDCWEAAGDVCVPTTGCPGVARPAGDPCDDGFGLEVGSCYKGWLVPGDQCDAGGHCLDMGYLVPTGIHPLAGTWFAVLSSAPASGAHETLTADLVFGQDGGLDVRQVRSTDPAWAESMGEGNPQFQGAFCAEIPGPVRFARGSNAFRGFADPSRSLMAFSGDDNTLGVALRSTGDAADLDGTYHVVMTDRPDDDTTTFQTWVGNIELEDGCIAGPGGLTTTVGLGSPLTFAVGSDCFVADAGRWRLAFSAVTEVGVNLPMSWSGAIGPRGDVLLLVRDEMRLHYGTILLVRARELVAPSDMGGTWAFVSQRGGLAIAGDKTHLSRLETGWVALGENFGSLFGRLDGDEVFVGQWWFTGAAGRYNQRAAFGGDLVHHTGYVAPSPDVLFAWVAQEPESDPHMPQLLRLPPIEGSLMVGVRWTPFEGPTAPSPN